MTVIKRNGRSQEFDINKILLTVENASDEAKAPMSSSDIGNVGEDVQAKIDSLCCEQISSAEIRNIVVDTLKALGFSKVSEYYSKGR